MMDDERRGTRDETTPRSVGRVLCLTSPRTCRTFELLFFLVSICALPILKRGPASPPSRFVSFSLHPVSLDIPGSANTLDCRPHMVSFADRYEIPRLDDVAFTAVVNLKGPLAQHCHQRLNSQVSAQFTSFN